MLRVEELSYGFPQKDLYEKVSFTLEDGSHAAFIGTNGTGKSTLISLIMDYKNALYDGKIIIDEPCTIGHVSQFQTHEHNVETSVFDFLMEPFAAQQKKVDDLCKEMESGENMEELLERYQVEWDLYTAMDCDNAEVNIKKELKLAGIAHTADLTIGQISGGEFKLIQIIRQMLLAPSLLIMDEPDAFLDFANLLGLIRLINNHKGTLLVVTHNRMLLTHCFDKILHLENKELEEYEGSYPEYRLLTLQTKIEQQASLAIEEEEIARNEKIVERMRNLATKITSASRGRALHARVSYLERLEARKTKSPFVDVPQPQIMLSTKMADDENPHGIKGNTLGAQDENSEIEKVSNLETGVNEKEEDISLLQVPAFSLGYESELLSCDGFTLGAHTKLAIVGANGTGKTTLLREIYKAACGKESKLSAISLGEEARLAYLSQMQGETLDEKETLWQCLEKAGVETKEEAGQLLESYTLQPEQMSQEIGQLSGGEKNLFQLLLLSLGDANLLLLDEPTSHLDVYAQEKLEDALKAYDGALLMVCHDFYTIANVADAVLYVEDGKLNLLAARTFRKKVYADTFDVKDLEKEQKRRQNEQRVEELLIKKNFDEARKVALAMEEML